jgi:hypothetical protein
MVKIAMFDEVNEATAILKAVSEPDQAPQPGYWLTLGADGDHLPNDCIYRSRRRYPRCSVDRLRLPLSCP